MARVEGGMSEEQDSIEELDARERGDSPPKVKLVQILK